MLTKVKVFSVLGNTPILTLFGVFKRNKGARQHPG